jgi:hypothetical protein
LNPFAEDAGNRIVGVVSARLDKSWIVLASYQIPGSDRCVDVFSRPDGTFGFEEFRQDVEDMGRWTPIAFFSAHDYGTEDDAVHAARKAVSWLGPFLDR